MKPEDVDKLFKERLGPSSPTPPADLWNRLQDRIETEMPSTQEQEQKPRGFMYLSYSIAAAIALVLSVGIVFYNIQRGSVPFDGMAHNNGQIAEQPLIITEPAPEQGIAQINEPGAADVVEIPKDETTAPETSTPAPPASTEQATIAKVQTKTAPASSSSKVSAKASAPVTQQFAQIERPVIPEPVVSSEVPNTGETVPATFASNSRTDMNAQPVEIIIKRAVQVQQAEYDEPSGFEKKQKLAKNIFKQVRNLSNGERVELSELGINADRIALETQIGKQKISKVINL